MKKDINIMICGGGTAGHIYPAVSIIENIQSEKYRDYIDICYVGTDKGPESTIIPGMGIDFYRIKAFGISKTKNFFRRISVYIIFVCTLLLGFFRCIGLILRSKPDMILGMGGYVCAPVLLAAFFLRKNIAIHEQNYIPGRLNYFFSRLSDIVFLSFAESMQYFNRSKRTSYIYSGNPVRQAIRKTQDMPADYSRFGLEKKRFTVVCFGGSLGAKNINQKIIESYKFFSSRNDLQFLLIPGRRFYADSLKEVKDIADKKDSLIFKVYPYVEKMQEVYAIADLVISRSGANTVAELQVTNIPAILIPYPDAIGNHQYYNARYLEKKNKAIIIEDKSFDSGVVEETIGRLLEDDKRLYRSMIGKKTDNGSIGSPDIIIEKILERIN